MEFVEYPDSEMMMMDLANTLAGELINALLTQERASFAVPGGSTPGPIFDSLCAVRLDWDRVDVVLTDERWVPESDPRSNTRLLREHLLVERAAQANYLSLYNGAGDAVSGAVEAVEPVEKLYPISVLLLGMGEDMHVASLFPTADNLAALLNEDAPAVMAVRGGGTPEERVTLTAGVLNSALARHMVITGAKKREALERAAKLGDPMEAPVAAVLPGLTVHWAE